MPNNLSSINLIKNKQIPLFDKFMNWALTVGRLIVIFTEIVAVSAFIYRFSLDERLIDLHSAIKQKQALISLLKQDETKYRNLQNRIALASTLSEKNEKTNKIVLNITDLIPQGVRISNLTFNQDKITINANVNSVSSLTDFINTLRDYPDVKSISIANIENKPLVGLSVTVTTTLK
ncbi:MAG: PilN domain-containing protein [Candidatus Levybacteria bacterium]|nr:PilN domain-containing protein [Candidatus Levybacteria bacterium]